MERYLVFDVETPNAANRRMSAIGVTVVENGEITQSYASLINPETHFDSFNIQLTGITPEMVQQAPTFPELWPKLRRLFEGGLLIAHNAPFDMSVLAKCLIDYGILWQPTARYACTCQMARRLYPEMENHRLDTMCRRFRLPLDHHNAASDSQACAGLLCSYLRDGMRVAPFVREYDLRAAATVRRSRPYARPRG